MKFYSVAPGLNFYTGCSNKFEQNSQAKKSKYVHAVWKSQKKSHLTMRAKRAMLTFWIDKNKLKMPNIVHFGEFSKIWSLQSTLLPDRSVLIGQNLVENDKIQEFKCDILSDFQSMWQCWKLLQKVSFHRLTQQNRRIITLEVKVQRRPFWVIFIIHTLWSNTWWWSLLLYSNRNVSLTPSVVTLARIYQTI